MERRLESTEPECGGAMIQNNKGQIPRHLSKSEKFYVRSCARCTSLLVTEWNHCVQCGRRVDSMIKQNHIEP